MLKLVLSVVLILFLMTCDRKSSTKPHDNFLKINIEKQAIDEAPSTESLLRLTNIFYYVRNNIPETNVRYNKTKICYDFNFNMFVPSRSKEKKNGTITIYYDDDKIVKISKVSATAGNSFEFYVIYNERSEYVSLIVYDTSDIKGKIWIDGFILIYHGKCYFIGEDRFDHNMMFKSSKRVSNIMLLDQDLRAKQTIAFFQNECRYMSTVNYKKGDYLFSESLYRPKEKWTLSDTTVFERIALQFERKNIDYSFWKVSKIGVVEEYANRPLWVFGGNHDHYPDGE